MTPSPSERATGADPRKVINWSWTIADMDRLKVMVQRRATAKAIADAFHTDVEDIREVCARNDLVVYPILGRRA